MTRRVFWTIWFVCFLLMMSLFVVTGCNAPHRLTAKEKAQQAAHKHQQEIQKRIEAHGKYLEKPATPPGIWQLDSTHFFVKRGYEQNIRERICTKDSGDYARGIYKIEQLKDGVVLTCNNAEHDFRQPPLTTTPDLP